MKILIELIEYLLQNLNISSYEKKESCGHTNNEQSKAIAKSSQIRHQIHQQQELQMEKELI